MTMDRSLATIFAMVVFLHAGLILWALATNSPTQRLVPTPPLVVKTISLRPPQTITPSSAPPAPSPKKAEPVAEKPKTKPSIQKKKETVAREDDPLLKTARQALQNLQKPVLVEPTQSLPSLSSARVETGLPYDQTLAQRLQQLIRLPEYGEVTIQLTLHRNGIVAQLEVLTSESESNRRYVQKELPNLRFPAFGRQFPGEEKHVFTLVLKNE